MSITQGFETRMGPLGDGGLYSKKDIDALLAHTRAIEAMLKKHERPPIRRWLTPCIECGYDAGSPIQYDGQRHFDDCQLAKLLEGVE